MILESVPQPPIYPRKVFVVSFVWKLALVGAALVLGELIGCRLPEPDPQVLAVNAPAARDGTWVSHGFLISKPLYSHLSPPYRGGERMIIQWEFPL